MCGNVSIVNIKCSLDISNLKLSAYAPSQIIELWAKANITFEEFSFQIIKRRQYNESMTISFESWNDVCTNKTRVN